MKRMKTVVPVAAVVVAAGVAVSVAEASAGSTAKAHTPALPSHSVMAPVTPVTTVPTPDVPAVPSTPAHTSVVTPAHHTAGTSVHHSVDPSHRRHGAHSAHSAHSAPSAHGKLSPATSAAIVAAIKKTPMLGAVPASDISVRDIRVSSANPSWASAIAHPRDQRTDDASVALQKVNGRWTVRMLGTEGVGCAAPSKLRSSLRLVCETGE